MANRILTFKHPELEPVVIEIDRYDWRQLLATCGATAVLTVILTLSVIWG